MESREWKKETIKQFDEWREKKNRFFFERRLETILPFVPKKSLILDVGCGDIEMLEFLRRKKKVTLSVGIDIQKNLIKNDIPIVRGDAENLPFKRKSFDCITATAILEHLPQPEKAIYEFRSILKSKGILIITTPNPIYSKLADVVAKFKLKYKEGLENPLTLNLLKKTLIDANFSITYLGGFLSFPIKIPLNKYLEDIFRWRVYGRTLLLNQIIVSQKN